MEKTGSCPEEMFKCPAPLSHICSTQKRKLCRVQDLLGVIKSRARKKKVVFVGGDTCGCGVKHLERCGVHGPRAHKNGDIG